MSSSESSPLDAATSCLNAEAEAILRCKANLDASFSDAIQAVVDCKGKLVVCAVGKSGWIGEKIASSFRSIGIVSVFLHASEAIHGDLGLINREDTVLFISNSGSTPEILAILPFVKKNCSDSMAIVGRLDSPLARDVDHVIDASIVAEAEPMNIAPTASSTVALALGDALLAGVVAAKQVQRDEYARFHPGGQLGRRLLLSIRDIMRTGDAVPIVTPESSIIDALAEISSKHLGAACVVSSKGHFEGLVTDGDIRRQLQVKDSIAGIQVHQIMNTSPRVTNESVLLNDFLTEVEENHSEFLVFPVVNSEGDKRVLQGTVWRYDLDWR